MKVGGLFAGIGGIELGFKKAGFDISWANEIDKNACITYRYNHKHTLFEKDLNDLQPTEVNPIDILTGGFPCQAFSIAGYQKGFRDDRGNVFFRILDFIDHLQPKVVFLENVKNLVGHDKGKTFERILHELEVERKYTVKSKILNSCEYGNVPQNRERIYIVAFKNSDDASRFTFPKTKKLTKKVTDLIDNTVDDKFYYTNSRYYPQLKEALHFYPKWYLYNQSYNCCF